MSLHAIINKCSGTATNGTKWYLELNSTSCHSNSIPPLLPEIVVEFQFHFLLLLRIVKFIPELAPSLKSAQITQNKSIKTLQMTFIYVILFWSLFVVYETKFNPKFISDYCWNVLLSQTCSPSRSQVLPLEGIIEQYIQSYKLKFLLTNLLIFSKYI